ncbi:MAG: hypothetical protein M5U35_06665 [Roseovarius sp.]|nr:hypothetical protein [Roseovarius sp.]
MQLDKLRIVLNEAYHHVPFYREKFREIGFDPGSLSSLEEFRNLDFIVTKEDVRNDTENFISEKARRSKLTGTGPAALLVSHSFLRLTQEPMVVRMLA